jgi:hypothetical protein
MGSTVNRQRVLSGAIQVGDYITTAKPTDVWWKVLEITETSNRNAANTRRFAVVNKAGYHKELNDPPGAGRKFYRWIPATDVAAGGS